MPKPETEHSGDAPLGEKLLRLVAGWSPRKDGSSWFATLKSGFDEVFDGTSLFSLVLVALLAAGCGTAVLFVLNAETREVEYNGYSTLLAVAFVLLLLVYRTAQNYLIRKAAQEIEEALHRKRVRTTQDVMALGYQDIQALRTGGSIDGLAAHYGALSQTLVPIINGAEGLVLLVFMFAYLLFLSPFAAVLTALVIFVTVNGFLNSRGKLQQNLQKSAEAESSFRVLTEGLVSGAAELRLHARKRAALQSDLDLKSKDLEQGRSAAASYFAQMMATGTSASYLMAGAVVFVMPVLTGTGQAEISRIVVAVIFLLGPVSSVVQTVQQLTSARFALSKIQSFEARVAEMRKAQTSGALSQAAAEFDQIEFEDVAYTHPGDAQFHISDASFKLKRGEILFVTGGNGSGKTTLLRLLTGLYAREGGRILLNSGKVPPLPEQSYRNLFATVFSDFHVFPRPYGLDEKGVARLDYWLTQLEIRDKFGEDLTRLAPETLSTGQRKRLALALALAEDRPILVLDEWAADQDPATRKRFYQEILPGLKAQGLTIVAVTHDDQYFSACDNRIHMTEGRIATTGESA